MSSCGLKDESDKHDSKAKSGTRYKHLGGTTGGRGASGSALTSLSSGGRVGVSGSARDGSVVAGLGVSDRRSLVSGGEAGRDARHVGVADSRRERSSALAVGRDRDGDLSAGRDTSRGGVARLRGTARDARDARDTGSTGNTRNTRNDAGDDVGSRGSRNSLSERRHALAVVGGMFAGSRRLASSDGDGDGGNDSGEGEGLSTERGSGDALDLVGGGADVQGVDDSAWRVKSVSICGR
jgi:hypothetical protein